MEREKEWDAAKTDLAVAVSASLARSWIGARGT